MLPGLEAQIDGDHKKVNVFDNLLEKAFRPRGSSVFELLCIDTHASRRHFVAWAAAMPCDQIPREGKG